MKFDQQSAYVQERRKWEMRPTLIDAQWINAQVIDGVRRAGLMDGTYVEPLPVSEGGRGGAPLTDYPRMLYKAVKADGGPTVDVLNGSGTLIVHSEREESSQCSRGWHRSQEEAIAAITAQDREFAKLAAERNFEVRRMSEKARAEVEAHEDASGTHLPTIPDTPIKKRGRPFKATPPKE